MDQYKKKYMVLIRNFSKEYKMKRIRIQTQTYKDRGVMNKLVVDITVRKINPKNWNNNNRSKNIDGTFVVKLRGLNIGNDF